ncbi:MAG: hypothetical protein HQL72_03710 [Magnetococcales bacterium]|nr:hypothetical protein [Magnetococcales bacterium]
MHNLDCLKKYFFGGQAESESEIRNDVFVEPPGFKDFMSFSISRSKILLGSKGIGKSILLYALHDALLGNDTISVLIDDVDLASFSDNSKIHYDAS